jgi:aldose 1-epimerase
VRNQSYIAKPDSLSVLRDQSSRYGVPILFPPGRVKLAAFTFEGREYKLPVNREPHHSHGELRYKPWKVAASGADPGGGAYVSAEIDFAEHPDMLAYFPHAALFRFTYRLQDGRLTLSGEIVNHSDQAMPLGLGFHPYFALAPGEADNVKVFIPAAAEWPLDAEGYTSGLPVKTPLIRALHEGIAVSALPDYKGGSQCFSMESGDAVCELVYEARGTKLVYEMGSQFPIHVLFTQLSR